MSTPTLQGIILCSPTFLTNVTHLLKIRLLYNVDGDAYYDYSGRVG